jgi:hypothetical protein
MEREKSTLETALHYLTKGYSVIPIKRNKKPFIPWIEYQQKKPTEDKIREWWDKWPSANVAIVTGKISNICAVDIDEPEGFKAIQAYIPDNFVIPTCKTPGGGQHLYFQFPDKPLNNNTRVIPGCDFRGEGGYVIAPPSQNGKGQIYAWLDGLSLDDVEPPALPSQYIIYINNNAFKIKEGIGEDDFTKLQSDFKRLRLTSTDFKKISEGQRDEILFHIANSILNRTMREQEVQGLLQLIARHCCDPPFPFKEIPAKIKSVLNRIERRERNIAQEVREWVLTSSGFFLTSDCYNGLQLTSREQQKACVLELLRMQKDGLIEKYGDRRGCYRRVEKEYEEMDFVNASTHDVDIKLPFAIEKFVEIMPGNIIVVAGEVNAGKTAFALNVVQMNMDRFDIHYFNSEMGASELRKRLAKFPSPQHLDDWNFKAYERNDNFADVIVSGEGRINIIDFLEIYDNFYEVGGRLAEIHKKLKGANAIVAIQKNPKVDVGLGGFRGLEKPRLYLAMSPGCLKIVKAKNWATTRNPNNLEINFKLAEGCRLIETNNWHLTSETP